MKNYLVFLLLLLMSSCIKKKEQVRYLTFTFDGRNHDFSKSMTYQFHLNFGADDEQILTGSDGAKSEITVSEQSNWGSVSSHRIELILDGNIYRSYGTHFTGNPLTTGTFQYLHDARNDKFDTGIFSGTIYLCDTSGPDDILDINGIELTNGKFRVEN